MRLESDEEISKYLDSLDKETRAIKKELFDLCWYMRGGLTYAEAIELSESERSIILDIVKEHLEITKNSSMPFF